MKLDLIRLTLVLSNRVQVEVYAVDVIPEDADGPGDPDPRVVDVVLAVVGPDQLFVVMHPEGNHQVDRLRP